ncbi:MAG: DALR anticodon-binding domain-containing protein, partial [bacterium]
TLNNYPNVVRQAGSDFSPALIANYVYDLVKEYNGFYQSSPILKEENEAVKNLRLVLSQSTAKVIASGMKLLGIDVPERM